MIGLPACLIETVLTQREDTGLSLVYLNLDDFKRINDTYGDQIDDIVLNTLGKLLSSSIRQSDIAVIPGALSKKNKSKSNNL